MTIDFDHLVIAIDGPAAAGKGSLARRLAKDLHFDFMDTGTLYRAVGLATLQHGGMPEKRDDAMDALDYLNQDNRLLHILKDPAIRSDAAGVAASQVGAIQDVRTGLKKIQRDFAITQPDGKQGVVLDGRDIGTVICPEAQVKFFVTASTEERAKRRFAELQKNGIETSYDIVLADMHARDARDSGRSSAPLTKTGDAIEIDTTGLSQDDVYEIAMKTISGFLS